MEPLFSLDETGVCIPASNDSKNASIFLERPSNAVYLSVPVEPKNLHEAGGLDVRAKMIRSQGVRFHRIAAHWGQLAGV